MADRIGVDDVYDFLTGASRDLEREYDLHPPYQPPSRPQVKGKTIKPPTYVPPHDVAGRIFQQQSDVSRQRHIILAKERRSQLVGVGMPEDISAVSCGELRSASAMLRTGGNRGFKARSKLEAQTKVNLHYEINAEIKRRCVPKSQRSSQ